MLDQPVVEIALITSDRLAGEQGLLIGEHTFLLLDWHEVGKCASKRPAVGLLTNTGMQACQHDSPSDETQP